MELHTNLPKTNIETDVEWGTTNKELCAIIGYDDINKNPTTQKNHEHSTDSSFNTTSTGCDLGGQIPNASL